jgi:hypothetical protein
MKIFDNNLVVLQAHLKATQADVLTKAFKRACKVTVPQKKHRLIHRFD